jgi:hypothetical protein
LQRLKDWRLSESSALVRGFEGRQARSIFRSVSFFNFYESIGFATSNRKGGLGSALNAITNSDQSSQFQPIPAKGFGNPGVSFRVSHDVRDVERHLSDQLQNTDRSPYVPKKRVALRYATTTRTVDRWSEDPALKFPIPLNINGRVYFSEPELIEWERQQAVKAISARAAHDVVRQRRRRADTVLKALGQQDETGGSCQSKAARKHLSESDSKAGKPKGAL